MDERFDESVSKWLEESAPARLPERVLIATFERTRKSKQQVGWRAFLGRTHVSMNRASALGGTAAIVLVIVTGAFVVGLTARAPGIGGTPTSSPGSASPATSPRASASPVTPPQSSFAERFGVWSRSSFGPPHVHAITAGGPGLVAVGAHTNDDEQADIWTSPDGRAWSRVPAEELGAGVIDDVTTGGPGLVAVGRGGTFHAAVWTSPDGLAWSRASDDPIFDDARIHAVSVGGPGLVAVGHHHRAWFSSDGLTWDLASVPPVPPDVYPGDYGERPQVYMTDVASAGDRLVAVGSMMMNDNSEEAVVWTSNDGTAWTDVPLDRGVFPLGSSVSRVIRGLDGFVAIGQTGRGSPPAMWTSVDGLRWSRVGTGNDPFRSTQPEDDTGVYLSSITAALGGYIAVGGGNAPCNGVRNCSEAAVWTSEDGRSWLRVPSGPVFLSGNPNPSATGAMHVTSFGSGFVVVGKYEGTGAIWISEPPTE